MSLINRMLRDLQQRQQGRPAAPPPLPVRPLRRRVSPAALLRSVPPVLWVVIGGGAGLLLLLGLSGWVAGLLGLGTPTTPAQPPAELAAIARKPAPPVETASASRRRTPPVPIDVPPPPPPLAYGSNAPAPDVVASAPTRVAPVPAAAPPRPRENYFSDQPVPFQPAVPVRPAASLPAPRTPAPAAATAPRTGSASVAASLPAHVHPDLLPGAVNATNLALQKAAREAAAAPPVTTPYGQAEAAYREGRQAYDANRTNASLEALERALTFYPGHLPARELLVDQLEMGGRTAEAYAQLKQGLAIAPDYTPFRKRAARMLLDRGDAAGAVRALTGSGLPRVEDDPELHQMLAGIYLQLGENFLAAQTYRNLLVHDPRDARYWLGLGDALAADAQPAEARKAYRKALAAGGLGREEAERLRSDLLRK